jgi:hypothetical protein
MSARTPTTLVESGFMTKADTQARLDGKSGGPAGLRCTANRFAEFARQGVVEDCSRGVRRG